MSDDAEYLRERAREYNRTATTWDYKIGVRLNQIADRLENLDKSNDLDKEVSDY